MVVLAVDVQESAKLYTAASKLAAGQASHTAETQRLLRNLHTNLLHDPRSEAGAVLDQTCTAYMFAVKPQILCEPPSG